jgi:radical SAM protein with 4Fe4S-binding SPASM domain
MKFAKLKKKWLLRGWTDTPKALVDCTTGFIRQLGDKEFFVAESCDGETDFDSLLFLPEHLALRDELIRRGLVEELSHQDPVCNIQKYRKAENPKLDGVQWCITGLCNLNCKHCYMESSSGRYGMLPLKDISRLISQFERANVAHVILTGGEPFIRNDILDIISLLSQKGICLSQIYSNGTLITDEHLAAIRALGFSPSFQISFDGAGTHDYMRGTTGIEQVVINSIKKIKSYGYTVIIATSIDKINCGSLMETYKLMELLEVTHWRVSIPQKTGNWRETRTALSLDETSDILKPLQEHWLKNGRPFDIQLAGFFNSSQIQQQQISSCYLNGKPHFSRNSYDCGSCRKLPNLLPDGTLVPCPGYVDSVIQNNMPNLLQEELSLAWTRSALREIVDTRKNDLLAHNPECSSCELFPVCGMGCRAFALTETGDIQAKDPLACTMWKMGYKKDFEDNAKIIMEELSQSPSCSS